MQFGVAELQWVYRLNPSAHSCLERDYYRRRAAVWDSYTLKGHTDKGEGGGEKS